MEILHRESPINPRTTLPCFLLALAAATACLAWAPRLAAQSAAGPAKLTYTKLLRGSIPEYMAVTVDANGEGSYEGRKLDAPYSPRRLKLSAATTQRLFGLAAALNYFQNVDLESHKKVANLGLKTFTCEREGQNHRAEFNYTQRREAQELTELFERIATVQEHIASLEHAIKYDPLALPKELLQIQMDLDRKALADPELLVPALAQIVRNPRFLHLAQVRAQNILQRLQNND